MPITDQLVDPDMDDRLSVTTVRALLNAALEEDPEGGQGVASLLAGEDVDAATVAELETDLLAARCTVSRLRRREYELSALFSSARELVELHDVDVLLRRLVQRAHDLIGTDITYLGEFDEANGELFIRTALGSVTPAFHDVRVPPGKGLAMKVAVTRSAHWSDKYFEDFELDHDDGVDAAVSGEGIVSMAGVPMLVDDRIVGVLVAANRSPRTFSTDEIVLLAAFADHASVVLQNARRLDSARAAASEAEDACAALTRHTEAMERAAALHTELTAEVLRGGSAEEVAAVLGGALKRAVLIVDRRGSRIAASGADLLPEPLPAEVTSAIDESRRSGRLVPVPGRPVSVVAVAAGDSLLGAVIVENTEPVLQGMDLRSVERAAQIVALLTLRQEAVADAEERVRGELVSDVLGADSVYRAELLLRARSRGVRLDELRTPVVVVVAPEHRRAALRAANGAVPGCLAGEHAGALTVLLPTEPPLAAAAAVRDHIRKVVPGPVLVVAGPTGAPETLPDRFELAQRCSGLLLTLERDDIATCTDGFAPYLAMFGSGRDDLAAYIEHTLGAVIEWDRERRTDLLPTLLGFVEANASPTRTARNLGLHTNTVLQRLERITALLGDGWREPEPLFRVAVAVRLHRMAASL